MNEYKFFRASKKFLFNLFFSYNLSCIGKPAEYVLLHICKYNISDECMYVYVSKYYKY